ncbi:response regulator [Paroceanicella profunda]|uniref:Response regulator n=1 Tax=Paroceanicella profunda TaxID=2579971 RepID=A0A5B8G0A3_9RHOB|nr:response regulator [Paroceanicella profunda]QDL93464.1 response regulator [Paroceanicella profunda]
MPEHRVLYVDDDAFDAEILARHLRREGEWIDTACGGVEAVTLLDTSRHRLVIIDWHLPDIEARDLACALRAADASLALIFLSGVHLPQQEDVAVELGACAVLSKDRDMAYLNQISRILAGLAQNHPPGPSRTRH